MKFQFLFFFLVICLIIGRYFLTLPKYLEGDEIKITTKISSEPIRYANAQYLNLYGLKTYLPLYPELVYGDKIVVTGIVQGDKLKKPKLVEIKDEDRGLLLNLRQNLIKFYKKSLPEPYSSLVSGIVIGSKNMPESFWQKLKETGTAHIVVASGTNVTMTAAFLISVLTVFLKRKFVIWLTILGIFGYVVISGFDAPIVRAGIMGSILLLSQNFGRLVNSTRLLVYAALIMLFIKPMWLIDLGFILSFVATISLMLFQKKIDLWLKSIPAGFREGLSTSIAAQIGVSPIIFVTFGQFNLLSPIINALILCTIPYIMVFGAFAGLIGIFIPILGKFVLFLIYPVLYYFVYIVNIF